MYLWSARHARDPRRALPFGQLGVCLEIVRGEPQRAAIQIDRRCDDCPIRLDRVGRALERLVIYYLGIADGMSIARVLACRYSK